MRCDAEMVTPFNARLLVVIVIISGVVVVVYFFLVHLLVSLMIVHRLSHRFVFFPNISFADCYRFHGASPSSFVVDWHRDDGGWQSRPQHLLLLMHHVFSIRICVFSVHHIMSMLFHLFVNSIDDSCYWEAVAEPIVSVLLLRLLLLIFFNV